MSIKNNFPTIRPSLNLDFANSKQVDPRITFTRASTATYWDGKTFAVAEENLLKYSHGFDNSAWTKNKASVVPGAATAPDGSTTATKLIANTESIQSHLLAQTVTSPTGSYCVSVFLKAGEESSARIGIWDNGATFQDTIDIDLLSGVITYTSNGGWSGANAYSTSAGDGWYRVVFSGVRSGGTATSLRIIPKSGGLAWAGDGSSGIYIWGAQIERRASVTAYTPTTDQPITKYQPVLQTAPSGVPRFDHNPVTGESLGLLIEEQRTNLLLNSAVLATQNVTVTATAYTLTFYGTGTVTLSGASSAGPLVATGANGRVSLTFTPTAGTLTLTVSGSVTNAQLEAGAFPTSYIPTTSAQATRAADSASMTGANFSSWYRADEGTVFAECSERTVNAGAFLISDGTNNNRITYYSNGDALATVYVTSSATGQATIALARNPYPTFNKLALAYKPDDFAAQSNSAFGSDVAGQVPQGLNILRISSGSNGHIKRIAYYPKRLSNTELQALTA